LILVLIVILDSSVFDLS